MQATVNGLRDRYSDLRHKWDKAKLKKSVVFLIVIGAIVLTMFLGFTQGGWRTDGTASKMAETSAQGAVIERLALICVAQSNADPQQAAKLVELKAVGSYQRSAYVMEQGWATMPGEAAPDNQVAAECAKQLMLIGD